jgi:hypothetical protein
MTRPPPQQRVSPHEALRERWPHPSRRSSEVVLIRCRP